MNNFSLMHRQRLWIGQFDHFTAAGIVHAISTRLGGVSVSPYAGLNLAFHVGDDAEAVRENRRRFCRAVGVDADRLTSAKQVHRDVVRLVALNDAGRGSMDYESAFDDTDALITNVPGIPLILFYADCVPVLLADPVGRAVGVCHAGWKGSASRIVAKTIQSMSDAFGTRPENLLAAVAPSIGPCCYEVDEVVGAILKRDFDDWADYLVPNQSGRYLLDLWGMNRAQLLGAGVTDENIGVSCVCTSDNTCLFYSYRADNGRSGRFGAMIML